LVAPRIIPCLLVHQGGLVKSTRFDNHKYLGDPLNAVRIFNEKMVDELIVLDIDATVQKRDPNYNLIRSLAAECRMPLCIGGGVTTADQVERIIGYGVEKVALSAAAVARPELVSQAARRVGMQSVVVVIDVKRTGLFRHPEVVTHNGRKGTGLKPLDFARMMQDAGAGEIVLNSVDNDGTMNGYDLTVVRSVAKALSIPLTIMGGAGSLSDIEQAIREFGAIGTAAGSLFVFKGRYRAVLINYPTSTEKDALLQRAAQQPAID